MKSAQHTLGGDHDQTTDQTEKLKAELAEVNAVLADKRAKLVNAERALEILNMKIEWARDHLTTLSSQLKEVERELREFGIRIALKKLKRQLEKVAVLFGNIIDF